MAALLLVVLSAGCAVPQPRGSGRLDKVREPTTGRDYWLYLPTAYVEASEEQRAERHWPLVVSFHGMKPYDTGHAQALEWEAEADRYGFIVVAPVLKAFVFIFGEFPLRTANSAFRSDELATLAILDHVFETTHADREHVLSTSWSSGGYMAHYMLNKHPDRFTCLAVRQSNFSASVLDAAATQQSQYHPILIVGTQNDFSICKKETQEAIGWYELHGYRNFAWINMRSLGHQRTPDTAADFFARVAGVTPSGPPSALAKRQAIDGNPTGLAWLAGKTAEMEKPPAETASSEVVVARPPPERPAPRLATSDGGQETRPRGVMTSPQRKRARGKTTPQRAHGATDVAQASSPVSISVSSTVGFEPLLLVYSADCPPDWYRTAQFHWLLNGADIGRGVNGQKTLINSGDHTLELRVVTRDGHQHRATREIRVLRNMEARANAPAAEQQ